jgi:CheY-like chemotaxis protein
MSEISLQSRVDGAGAPAATLRILVIEDHVATRRTMIRMLERRGHVVLGAGTGEDAIRMLQQNAVDLVISDVGLPDTNGFALLPKLREIRPGIPAIALSGYGMPGDLERSSIAGFREHLTKPVPARSLDEAIARAHAQMVHASGDSWRSDR